MTVVRAEIRCCCDPAKLLGTVLVPESLFVRGTIFRFRLETTRDLSPMLDDFGGRPEDVLELPLDEYDERIVYGDGRHPDSIRRLAIKSNDTPIEKLRRIPGFIEAES